MLISDSYRESQRQMHEKYDYGTASLKYASVVASVMNANGVKVLVDYGAGRCNLIKALGETRAVKHAFQYIPYEPSDARYSDPPEPAEMVACIDVLEHIEPELLDNVLDDLKRVTAGIGVFTVATGPAVKTLPDGRNAHLIQEPAEWWLPKIMSRFDLQAFQAHPGGFLVMVLAKDMP